MFEPIHGSAPKHGGLNKANPVATILAGKLMLEHLKEFEAAQNLENAIKHIFAENKYVTYDMKPERNDPTAVGTREMGEAVIAQMKRGS